MQPDDDGGRDVSFFFVVVGKAYKKIYNNNCTCNILLDQIKRDSLPALSAVMNNRLLDIVKDRAATIQKQEDYIVRWNADVADIKSKDAAAQVSQDLEKKEDGASKGPPKTAQKAQASSKNNPKVEEKNRAKELQEKEKQLLEVKQQCSDALQHLKVVNSFRPIF